MSQEKNSRKDSFGSDLAKAFEGAKKGGQRAARKLTGKQQVLSLAMLDQDHQHTKGVDRAFVQSGVCL